MAGPYLSSSGTDEPQHGRARRARRHSRCQRSIGMPVLLLMGRRRSWDKRLGCTDAAAGTRQRGCVGDSESSRSLSVASVSQYYPSSSTRCQHVSSIFWVFTFPPHLSSASSQSNISPGMSTIFLIQVLVQRLCMNQLYFCRWSGK